MPHLRFVGFGVTSVGVAQLLVVVCARASVARKLEMRRCWSCMIVGFRKRPAFLILESSVFHTVELYFGRNNCRISIFGEKMQHRDFQTGREYGI